MIFYPSESFIFGMFLLAVILWELFGRFTALCDHRNAGVQYSKMYKRSRKAYYAAWIVTILAIGLGIASSLIDVTQYPLLE